MIQYLLIAALVGSATATNFALGKPATTSSTWVSYNGSLATDGNTDGDWESESCFATNIQDSAPWWMVDLEQVITVDNVVIYNRADCCGERLQMLTVTVYTENPDVVSDAEGTPCATFEGPADDEDVVTLQCEGEVSGRYIRITKQKSLENELDLLSFCEVEVTAKCPSGFSPIDTECLRFVPSFATFAEALTNCESVHSHLLMIKTESLDNAVRNYMVENKLNDTYYVGAMDLEETGVFQWVDGSTVDVPWRNKNAGIAAAAVEEIKNAACGYLNGATGAWQAMYCSEPNFFICQRPL
ncbi:CD209 antigen-like protein 2 [Haliotis cracherodii]|uniref:CD209 antigen-like protein 2 n=1 Tax=Haliotis cracherodii TaxID=6455 RepID=UPI0039ED4E0D